MIVKYFYICCCAVLIGKAFTESLAKIFFSMSSRFAVSLLYFSDVISSCIVSVGVMPQSTMTTPRLVVVL